MEDTEHKETTRTEPPESDNDEKDRPPDREQQPALVNGDGSLPWEVQNCVFAHLVDDPKIEERIQNIDYLNILKSQFLKFDPTASFRYGQTHTLHMISGY